jgi:serine/threonine-protein kinase
MLLIGKTIGPFAIDKELGHGAMGTVYRARHTDSGKVVAIKIVAPALASNETVMQRFEREWEILKQLKHPNIVRLIANGRFSGTPFYAMEYIEGVSLDKIMARRGRMGWEEVVHFGQQLCAALKHAHDKGIVHRDLKPSNLMILKDGSLKLTDFGIAKDLDRTAITEANCTVGTASYMSPEQCKGERNLTHRSDLYSMGVVFYELLTGRKPFVADNAMEMFMMHVHGKFERPSRLVMEIPIWFDTLVCQLMEKDPERRPYDAAMVGEALNRVREKVEAQQAAGIDAVKVHNKDKPPEAARVDDEDKDAARALLGKKKKKKRRQELPGFYRSVWFKAAVCAGLLLAIVVVLIRVVFVNPSADDLYQSAAEIMKTGDHADKWAARTEGPISRYLTYYKDLKDSKTADVINWADKIDVAECERWLLNRLRNNRNTGGVDEDEKTARNAVEAEDIGDLKAARELWKKLQHYKDEAIKPEPTSYEQRSFGLLAEHRLKKLDEVEKLDKELTKKNFKAATDREKLAVAAMQEHFAEKTKEAREKWEDLKKRILDRDKAEDRLWWLLAVKHIRSSDPPKDAKDAKKDTTGLMPRPVLEVATRAGPAVQPEPATLLLGRTPPILFRISFKKGNADVY